MRIVQLKACKPEIYELMSIYLWEEWYNSYISNSNMRDHRDLRKYYETHKGLTYVLFLENRFVGLYTLNWQNYFYLYLNDVYVVPEYRKHKFGKILVWHAKRIAATLNCCLYLHAYEEYVNFYKKYGFKVIQEPTKKDPRYLLFCKLFR